MNAPSRWFVVTALVSLVVAALLHMLFLLGYEALWPALTHLLLLGWTTAMIYAVNYHTMPIFSGRDFPSLTMIYTHWILLSVGVGVTTIGFVLSLQLAIIIGLLLELMGSIVFIVNTILLFRRGQQRPGRPPLPPTVGQSHIDRLATHGTKTSGLCLPLALTLLFCTQFGWLSGSWWLAGQHLITLGWVLLMIVGVAYHMLPRFSGQPVRGPIWVAAQIGSHIAAVALIVVAIGFGWAWLFALGGTLVALSLAVFAWTIWPTLARTDQMILED